MQNIFCDNTGFYGGDIKYLYFLPEGEEYWGYSWTKGYFISNSYLSKNKMNQNGDGVRCLLGIGVRYRGEVRILS